MRNGQNKRMRGRNRSSGGGSNNNNNRGHNPLTKVFESNGPDVKIRGTASHVADKYIQLARDAQSSGDPVAAENYYQHAEHYFRLIAAAQEQFRQSPQYNQGQNNGSEIVTGNDSRDGANESFDDDEGEDMGSQQAGSQQQMGEQPQFGTRDPQPYLPRDAQFEGQNNDRQQQNPQPRQQNHQPRQQNQQPRQQNYNNNQNLSNDGELNGGLPSFITGGGAQPQPGNQEPTQGGFENGDNNNSGGERFGFRRRGRHRRPAGAPRSDAQGVQGGVPGAPQEGGGGDDTPPQG